MKHRWLIWPITLFLTTGLFLFAADSRAQTDPQWSLTILESDARHLLFELTLPSFEVETVTHDNVDYHRLAVDRSWSRWGTPGQPLLPIYNVLVGMPWPGDPQVSIVDMETELFDNYYLYPTPELAFGDSQEAADLVEVFALDQATYEQDVTYPGFLAAATENGFMREQPLFQLRLSPFQFNPVQRWMTVARRMKILITFPPAPSTPSPTAPVSASFQQSLQRLLINYPALPVAQATPQSRQAVQALSNEGSYIIITHPNFFDAVQELATYRTSQGESVVVKKSSDIYGEFSGGTKSAQAIRDYLTDAYATWQTKPEYVLLVGDGDVTALETDPEDPDVITGYNPNIATDFIPSHYETVLVFGPAPLDVWYGKVHGNDDYPDLIIGRIPARKASEVSTVISKIKTYEQTPAAGSWARKALLVADGLDSDNNGQSDFAPDMDTVAALLPPNLIPNQMSVPSGQSVLSDLAPGSLITAYSGHGSETTWGSGIPIFKRSNISSMTNANKYPFVTVANCSNGYFVAEDRPRVLAEEFLLIANKGSIATWAPAAFSFPSVNTPMNEEIYRAIFEDDDHILGSAARTALIEASTKNPHFDRNLFETFTFFGDPATRLAIPPLLAIASGTSVTGNQVTYSINYDISGAAIARGVTVAIALPDGLGYQSASLPPSGIDGQIISWHLGDVTKGTYLITVTAVIDPGPKPQDPQTAEVLISDASGQEITNGTGTTLGTKHIYVPLLLK